MELTTFIKPDNIITLIGLIFVFLRSVRTGSSTEFCQIHFIRRELVALFCLQLLKSLCYSVIAYHQ